MNREDGTGSAGDGLLDQTFVEIQCVRPDVDENGPDAKPDEATGGGYESERGDQNLIPRLEVKETRRHFQGGGARYNEQHPGYPESLLEQTGTLAREMAIPPEIVQRDRLSDVEQLLAGNERTVERDIAAHGHFVVTAVGKVQR
jgi:hypothetical protein